MSHPRRSAWLGPPVQLRTRDTHQPCELLVGIQVLLAQNSIHSMLMGAEDSFSTEISFDSQPGISSARNSSPPTILPGLMQKQDTSCRNPFISDPEYVCTVYTCPGTLDLHLNRSWDCSCHEEMAMACPIPALSEADIDKHVEVKNGRLSVNSVN